MSVGRQSVSHDAEALTSEQRLRRIEAITDAALAGLDPAQLLEELLSRLRHLLHVDTAVILLRDQHTGDLVATAANGLEEEVRRGVRIGMGHGFAGRVAAQRRPIIIDHLTSADVVNPVLLEAGVRSLLGVPMLAGGAVVGVLHVGTLAPRQFTDDDVQLVRLAADRAATVGYARERVLDRQAALALQRGLLPVRLPTIAGLDLAARYLPGHDLGVGGDWYDVFTLPNGCIGIVMGDVSGHGLHAAITMGRIRSALRAYALDYDDPAAALSALDRKIHHFEAGPLTTVIYALIAPDRSSMRLSCAGHLPPVWTTPAGSAQRLNLTVDRPLGVGQPGTSRHTSTVQFEPGTTLLLYTDGLIERRDEIIDTGLDRLIALTEPGPADALCENILAETHNEHRTDDLALLVIRRQHY